MLDRAKLLQQLESQADNLFIDYSQEFSLAQRVWHEIAQDPLFAHKIKAVNAPWLLPGWSDTLDKTVAVGQANTQYTAFAVDGSQIYPDKHQGTTCYLINIGSVCIWYGQPKPVWLWSEPYVFVNEQQEFECSPEELVNCRRQELELKIGLAQAQEKIQEDGLFLFDGSLIFWHLEAKGPQVKHRFLSCYLTLLSQFHTQKILHAGYISLPKSKELANLVRVALCEFDCSRDEYKKIEHVNDATICKGFLQEGERTIVFKHNSPLMQCYPEQLQPHFFYIHVGNEVGRVEIPAWIAQDEVLLEQVCATILDQCRKGNGYPVVLAESHEQAVIKGPDREFFYHLIAKFGFENNKIMIRSQKSIKKRGIGI